MCGGRCKTSPGWRTPCNLPPIGDRPDGVHEEDRTIHGCPVDDVAPGDWSLVRLWQAWRLVGGAIHPGSVVEQPAQLVDAFQVLEYERALIEAGDKMRAHRRAQLRQTGR